MNKSFRKVLPLVSLVTGAVAIAATVWGPFLISTHAPGITFDLDRNVDFQHASNAPRLVMQTSVTSIERGDSIRVIYADGRIFDFEVVQRCSSVSGIACSLGAFTEKSSPNQAPVPTLSSVSDTRIQDRIDNGPYGGCVHGSPYPETLEIQTGYWESSFVVYGPNTFGTTARWVDTGIVTVPYGFGSSYNYGGAGGCR
jgi:hypothetical protein